MSESGSSRDKPKSRREFLRSAGRGAALLGLAAVAASLIGKGRVSAGGQTCANRGICGGCVAFDKCGLPAALSARQAREGGRG